MSTYSRLDSSSQESREWLSEEDNEKNDGMLHLDRPDRRHYKESIRSWLIEYWRALALHAMLVAANLTVLLALTSTWLNLVHSKDHGNSSPLQEAVSYEERSFDLKPIYLDKNTPNPDKINDLNGPPRKELESAWGTLMQYQNVRLTKKELGQFRDDDSIVELADGTGYWSTVSVFHGLHCVERLHHILYAETYYPNLSANDTFTLKRHTEHCLDWLRHYIQCNVDTTLIPIQWAADSAGPVATDAGKHKCVAWDPIYEWMARHSFNPSQPGLLIHPLFGDSYHNGSQGHGHGLGITPLGKGGVLLHGSSGNGH